ncbi:MAG: GFA family protein [Pseudomonadota bacterium]
MEHTAGHCFCGKTTWAYAGPLKWSCYCHCDDCRRNCAAPVVAWVGVPFEAFHWTGQTPKVFRSAPGVRRHFCADCGTPMAFEADHYPDDMHIYAASFQDPSRFKPEFHVYYQSKLPWLNLHDDLPKYSGTLLESPLKQG